MCTTFEERRIPAACSPGEEDTQVWDPVYTGAPSALVQAPLFSAAFQLYHSQHIHPVAARTPGKEDTQVWDLYPGAPSCTGPCPSSPQLHPRQQTNPFERQPAAVRTPCEEDTQVQAVPQVAGEKHADGVGAKKCKVHLTQQRLMMAMAGVTVTSDNKSAALAAVGQQKPVDHGSLLTQQMLCAGKVGRKHV